MVMTVELSEQTLKELTTLTEESDPAVALGIAANEYIRYMKRLQLLELPGKVEMVESWKDMDQAELRDNPYGHTPGSH